MGMAHFDPHQKGYVEAINQALRSLSGAPVQWWNYAVYDFTLEIVVGDPLGKGNVILCLTGCERISGPVSWDNQDLHVVWTVNRAVRGDGRWHYTLIDRRAGFRAEGGGLRWCSNFDIVRNGSTYLWRSLNFAIIAGRARGGAAEYLHDLAKPKPGIQ
jgi:hypothetical protein